MILKKEIKNKEKYNDYILSTILLLSSSAFLLTGISSYTKSNLIFFLKNNLLPFIPQGITMLFYGSLGLILSLIQIINLIFEVGEGYNEFNKEKNLVTIFRKNYPGKNTNVEIKYNINDILRIIKSINKYLNYI